MAAPVKRAFPLLRHRRTLWFALAPKEIERADENDCRIPGRFKRDRGCCFIARRDVVLHFGNQRLDLFERTCGVGFRYHRDVLVLSTAVVPGLETQSKALLGEIRHQETVNAAHNE